MKKISYLFIALFIVSCSNENQTTESILEENQIFKERFYFKGNFYEIEFTKDSEGNTEPYGEIPIALQGLEKFPELATVFENDTTYFFEDESEKFTFYGDDYEALIESRKKSYEPTQKNPAILGEVQAKMKFYHDSYFNGNTMNINSLDDLINLTSINFNDKASSCQMPRSFVMPGPGNISNPLLDRRVIMYEHANFSGKSIEISNYTVTPFQTYGHERFKSLSSALFSNWNDKISSIDIVVNNISQVR
ncbi:hypothetical protein V1387_06240 [Allomuricauda taeanensis]|uniref:hypothetical protein n=1 Tax=Flagellimonas taeanensis TaxID=1005926 RepID=UPI002E7B8C28|nr:hypothetical protein [Allomuricauda taeanensis]MEE1962275.1 hypothetical protein [Allomuricauda taeanensis]